MAQLTDWIRVLNTYSAWYGAILLLLSRWMGRQAGWQPAYAPVRRTRPHLSQQLQAQLARSQWRNER